MATPDVQGLISQAAADNGVSPELLTALLTQESSLNPKAQNASTGALGMAQLMPTTARMLGVSDPTDPTQAIPAAAKYLKQGLDKYGGDVTQALKFYYGGPNEKLWGPKTQAYPGQVMARLMPPIDQSAAADPNTMLSVPPAAAGASLGDVFNRFRDYLGDTVKNAAAQFPTYEGNTPQDILQNVAKSNPENFQKLFGLATGFTGGGLTFGGMRSLLNGSEELANKANEALDTLQELEVGRDNPITSEDNENLWRRTGWFVGPDGMPRFEIPDEDAAFKQGRGLRIDATGPENLSQLKITEPTSLGEILDHPKLFAAYPDLQYITVKPATFFQRIGGVKGAMDSANNTMYLAPQPSVEAMQTMLHESQHWIQDREDFARGGSAQEFLPPNFDADYMVQRKKLQDAEDSIRALGINPILASVAVKSERQGNTLLPMSKNILAALPADVKANLMSAMDAVAPYDAMRKEAFSKYQRLAGEVESRNVEERYLREESGFPLHTEGYPDYPQILKFRGGLVAQRVDHDPFSLESVEHDPFALSPVDHDPFKSN